MCGIAGEINFKHKASPKNVNAMLSKLTNRGPDNHGILLHDNICLGHQRLKIIDLSNHAKQPMVDSHLNLSIIFNGCIYNYQAIKRELMEQGYNFFSTSDTEVILKSYHYWGESCLEKFNGMFAFAILNGESGDLFIARDRIGIKPLYYTQTEQQFLFASTLPALLQVESIDKSLDPFALNQYISFRAVVGNHSILKNIKKLPAGHWMKITSNGDIIQKNYWQINPDPQPFDSEHNEEYWLEKLTRTFTNSVKKRLVADVPVGVLLSGGLDSSMVVGLLSELGQKNLHTFSIGFDNVANESGNEFQYSDIIAKHYNTEHTKIFAQHDTLIEHLEPCIEAMSEPMVSHDVIGFYLLSKEVSQHVKVVQSGQGADEVFAGYHWYPPMLDIDINHSSLLSSKENQKRITESAARTYANSYFSFSFSEYKKMIKPQFLSQDYAFNTVKEYFKKFEHLLPIDRALALDTQLMLVDDPVKRVDNMTMAFGLEARVPFLDHELLELAFQIPYQLKVKDGGKYLLKQMARKIIPHEVIDRPKGYFPVPALKNMKNEYLSLAKNIFSSDSAKKRGLFDIVQINKMLSKPESFVTPFGSKLWQVTLLELWLQKQGL